MAISDRITSIEEHIKESYQELEGIGIDTTGVNNNLENIPKLIDGYWETLPKVTGEGTSITLDNTKEGKMKINLKGNTSQATTTGKNLLLNIRDEGYTVTSNGITFKVNADKSITVSGTATGVASMSLNTSTPVTLTAGTYTLSKKETTDVQVAIWYDSASVFTSVRGRNNTIQKTISQDTTYNNWRTLVVVYQGVTVNTTVYPMLEKSSAETSYEPYTNGASPNPDYPQDIHVVSGDNSINVVGKNLFKPTFQNNGTNIILNNISTYSISNGEFSFTASGTDMYFGNVKNAGTEYSDERGIKIFRYDNDYISFNLSNTLLNRTYITAYDSNNISLGFTNINSYRGTYQFPSGCDYITIRFGKADAISGTTYKTTIMVAYGNTIPTYEPYIGNTYPINLGVENYLPNNATTQTINGVTYTINEDKSIKINGTASGRADLWLYGSTTDTGNYVFIPKGNYTISTANLNDGTMFLSFREKTAGVRYLTRQNNGAIELLAQQDCYFYGIMLAVESGKTINNLTFYPQIEKGTKLNSYTPYGTTPIELCKIGTYQDSIKKSTGKNLINFNNLNDVTLKGVTTSYLGSKFKMNGTTNEAGHIIAIGNNLNITIPAGTYTLTIAVESGSNTGVGSGKDTAFYLQKANNATIADRLANITIGQLNTNNNKYSVTFTTDEAVPLYIYAYTNNSGMTFNNYVIQVQLEKGTQDTSFEPYGTGWYVKKEIGKIVLNGSEAWTYYQNHLILGQSASSINMIPSTNQALCDYYAYTSQGQDKRFTTGNSFSIQVFDSSYTDTTTFKNWLSTHNMTVYYALNTPTYTEITGELLSQLNALAKSYTSQTNISQESNDLASLLNATALSE